MLVVAGTGAALAGLRAAAVGRALRRVRSSPAACSSPLVFAAGRFGADVGAAIVLPVGGGGRRGRDRGPATAHGTARRSRRRSAVLALIALADLVSGANAHLTRSVLDAGGLGDLADVAQRRLQLSAHSFARPIVLFFLPLVAALAVFAVVRRDRLDAWLEDSPAMRAGLLGAARRDRGRHPRQRLRRPPAGDRHRLPARLRRLCLEPSDPRPRDFATGPLWAIHYPLWFVRIALVSPYSWTYQGGVNRHVEALAEEFLGRGHHVRVLAPFDPPGRLSRVLHRAAPESARDPRLPDPARAHGGLPLQRRDLQPRALPGRRRASPRAASCARATSTSSTSTSRSCRWSAGTPRSAPTCPPSAPSTPTRPRRCPTTSPRRSARGASSTASRPGSPSPRRPPGPGGAGTAATTR